MRRLGRALLVLGSGLYLSGCASGRVMNIRVSSTAGEPMICVAEVDGQRIAAADFPAFAQHWRGREAHLTIDINAPYRCLGGIIYGLQRAGFRRIGFNSQPAPNR